MYLQIFAIILIIAGVINGYFLLFNYPKEFEKSKPVHGVVTLLLLILGIFLLIN